MAIKISGTTVIDNSCNVTNANDFCATTLVGDGSSLTGISLLDRTLKPGNQSPADAATDVELVPTLTGTIFVSSEGKAHCCTCFQVSECSDFSTCNSFTCEIAGACTSVAVPAGCLSDGTQHFFRLRYEDEDGCCSEFSDATCFTTVPLPSTLGESTFGGFYMGTIGISDGSCYYLIMAPNATGCADCIWKTTRTSSGVGNEQCDGYGNTYDHLANATHPAGNWTATRSIGGFSDWYLPAICELDQLYDNKASAPAGEGFTTALYWSSTEGSASDAFYQFFSNGSINDGLHKGFIRCVRAVRRVSFYN